MVKNSIPPAEGVRLPWRLLPESVRAGVESRLGSSVVAAADQRGGFSPGGAAVLTLADGRRVFVKTATDEPSPTAKAAHLSEGRVMAHLGASVPAPRLLGDFEVEGWAVLVFEAILGTQPPLPWQKHDLERVLLTVAELGEMRGIAPAGIRTAEKATEELSGWAGIPGLLSTDASLAAKIPAWALSRLPFLAELERDWGRAAAGDSLVHGDIRSDNILLTEDKVYFVDWSWAMRGAAWIDLVAFLPSVAMQGGPAPWDVFDYQPTADGAPASAVTAMLAGFTGMLLHNGLQPPPAGLPTLRQFQLGQAEVALQWLRRRLLSAHPATYTRLYPAGITSHDAPIHAAGQPCGNCTRNPRIGRGDSALVPPLETKLLSTHASLSIRSAVQQGY